MKIVEMRLHMDCHGCKSKIKKLALQRLEGWPDQKKVLKTVRKTGRQAELWPYPDNPEYHDFTSRYCNQYHRNPASSFYAVDSYTPYNYHRGCAYSGHDDDDVRCSSYNYYEHRYNGHDHGYSRDLPHSTTIFDDRTGAIFSDDNAHGCSIM